MAKGGGGPDGFVSPATGHKGLPSHFNLSNRKLLYMHAKPNSSSSAFRMQLAYHNVVLLAMVGFLDMSAKA